MMPGMNDAELQARMDDFQRCIEQRDAEAAEVVLDDQYALVLVHPARTVTWCTITPCTNE